MIDLRTTFYIIISLLIGFMLTILPLPAWATWYRPAWMALFIIYWSSRISPTLTLSVAWLSGIIIDALYGTLLGEHAFVLTLIAYLSIRIQSKLSLFPVIQQAFAVLLLILLYQLILTIIQGMLGELTQAAYFWMPAVTSTLMWPWVLLIFRSLPTDKTPKIAKPRLAFLDF